VKKINIFVVCVSIVSVAACGDTITSVNTGSGGTSSNDDGGENVDSSGGDDAGTIKDASVNDIIANDSSLIDSPGQSCTTGHVRCSGVAQECIASAWTSAAAACNSSCSQPAGCSWLRRQRIFDATRTSSCLLRHWVFRKHFRMLNLSAKSNMVRRGI